MSTRNFVQDVEYGESSGVDSTTPISQLTPGFLRDAKNANLGTSGGYEKRAGYVPVLETPWSTFEIRSAVEFKTSDGLISQRLFYGVSGADGRIGKESGNTIVDLPTFLPAGPSFSGISAAAANRMAFVQLEDRLFMFNGDSTKLPALYDGSAVRDLGLGAHPDTAATASTPTSGGSLSEGQYIYTYTWAIRQNATSRILYQTNPAPLTTVAITAAGQKVTLEIPRSLAVLNNTGLSLIIRIFRTVVNGTVPFLEAEISNADDTLNPPTTTNTYESSIADAELEDEQLEYDNDTLDDFAAEGYDKAQFPVVARNRLFVVSSQLNEVRFSKISQHGPMPETFPALNFVSTNGEFGSTDKVLGLGQVNGIPIVLKQKSIGRLEEIGLPEVTKAEDPVTFIYREMSTTVGAISHFAQTQVYNELIFLGKDNIYATDGQQIRPIGTRIQDTISRLGFSADKNIRCSAINDTKFRRIYFQVFQSPLSLRPDVVIVGDYQRYPDFRWTFYTPGERQQTHPGIQAASFFQFQNPLDGSFEVFFGNSGLDLSALSGPDQRGQYFKLNTGGNDDGFAIYFRIVSRPYSLGQPLVTKLYKNVYLLAESTVGVSNFDLAASFNLDEAEEFVKSFKIAATGSNWDNHFWLGIVKLATTANIPLSGNQIIDGVLTTTGDRILVKNQTTKTENGVYVASSGVWTRSGDADENAEFATGMAFEVETGTVNAGKFFELITPMPIVLGSTNIEFDETTTPNTLIWSTSEREELTQNLHRKAKFMQLVIKQLDSDSPVSVFGWGVSGSIMGPI